MLKLEKGYDFGDVILDADAIPTEPKTASTPTISTSLFHEVKEKEKKLCVVGTKPILEKYKTYWSSTENGEKVDEKSVQLVETEKNKAAVAEACSLAYEQNLTLCHVVTEDKDKVRKWTKKLWNHTCSNGLFLTIWTGSPTKSRAFVGIGINKAKID